MSASYIPKKRCFHASSQRNYDQIIPLNILTLNMDDYPSPNKKPRLVNDEWENLPGNDDLWGQGELTAEEFDLLEIQATQKISHNATFTNRDIDSREQNRETLGCIDRVQVENQGNSACSDLKVEQYALEGKIKILNESLNKTYKQLDEERLKRDEIITARTEEFKHREVQLKKEIEHMQTALQFKEQEMKNMQSKVQMLEQRVQGKNDNKDIFSQQSQKSFCGKNSNKFLNRFDFENKTQQRINDASTQTNKNSADRKTYQLHLSYPQGERPGYTVVSDILNQKFFSSSASVSQFKKCDSEPDTKQNALLVSLARLNQGLESEEIWTSYHILLNTHIEFLKTHKASQTFLSNSSKSNQENKAGKSSEFFTQKSSNSIHSTILISKFDDQHCKIMSCLKGLSELLHWKCPPENPGSRLSEVKNSTNKNSGQQYDMDMLFAASCPLFTDDEEKTNIADYSGYSLLNAIVMLLNPDSYPANYPKHDEIECSLTVLLSWSAKKCSSLGPILRRLPLSTLIDGSNGIKCACTSLRLVSYLVTHEQFKLNFVHRKDICVYVATASLCHHTAAKILEEISDTIIMQVAELICQSFAILGKGIFNNESCSCSFALLQNFVLLLWEYYKLNREDITSKHLNVLKKGLLALQQISIHVKNFKEKRAHVENNYVVLMSNLAKQCIENSELKPVLGIIRDLWDFQDELPEFDRLSE